MAVGPLRFWTLSGYYRIASFSDHNVVNWFNLNSAHLIVQGRRQLRGLINYDFYSFENQTIFGPGPDPLVGGAGPVSGSLRLFVRYGGPRAQGMAKLRYLQRRKPALVFHVACLLVGSVGRRKATPSHEARVEEVADLARAR